MSEIKSKTMSMKERKERVSELVDLFSKNESFYKSKQFVEAEARSQFIDSFLECLGWDVKNERRANPNHLEVVVEDRLVVDGNKKHPDYTLGPSGQKVFYIEAKQPSVDLKQDPEPAFQIRRYGYTAKMPVALLTDFEELGIYDTKIKPSQKDNASTARIDYYNYRQYVEKFEEIYNRFSFEAVDKGWFDEYAGSSKFKKGTATVDDDILKMIEQWRVLIAEDIALHNEDIDEFNLTGCVQKIIDRIIFLRICEDKDIENEKQLLNLAQKKDENSIYSRLKNLFEKANEKYNAGLFASDPYLDSLNIQDKTLSSIIKALYYPECQYEFSVLPVEILGSIYERFLGKLIRFTRKTKNGHSILIEEKPEVQKAGGVFYTPSYIVDYIVKNTIGEKIKNLTPEEVSELKFCDPACGSGSFLVGAFQYLLDWHLDWYLNEKNILNAEKNGIIYKDVQNHTYKLSVEEKKRILLNNIYGVDIDVQAVEVTKLSLFLKLLENEGNAIKEYGANEIFRKTDLAQTKILPSLKDNIQCGNSLIGSDYYNDKNMLDFGIEEQRKINCFDWEKRFPKVFEKGGFDCVIGNPPYVSAPNQIELFPEQRNGIIESKRFKALYQKWDLYIPFVELSMQILKKEGLYSSIIPYPVTNQLYGKVLREMILNEWDLLEIADLNGVKVFPTATVTNCIPIIRKSHREVSVSISRLIENNKIEVQFAKKHKDLILDEKNYVWSLTEGCNVFNKHSEMHVLGDFCYVSYGLRPNSDEKKSKGEFKKEDLISNELDGVPRRKYIEAKDIDRYKINRIRFLEYGTDRSPGRLVRPTFDQWFDPPKMFFNRLGDLCGVIDWDNKLLHNDSIIGAALWTSLKGIENKSISSSIKKFSKISREEMEKLSETVDLRCLLGIMNSKYAAVLLSGLRGGDYHIYPEHIRNIPIPDLSAPSAKSAGASLSLLVDQMLEVQQKLNVENLSDSDRKFLEQRRDIIDSQINAVVYELYGLTDEEIKALENS